MSFHPLTIRCLSGPLAHFISFFLPRSHLLLFFLPVMCPVRLDQQSWAPVSHFLQCFYFERPRWCLYGVTSILILLCIWLFSREHMSLTYLSTLSPRLAPKSQFAYCLMGIPNSSLWGGGGLTQNSWHLLVWLVDLSFTFRPIFVFPASLLISRYCGCFCRTGNESVSPQSAALAFYHTETWSPSSGCSSLL